jgi:hypothetical protein
VDTARLQRFIVVVTQFQHRFSGRYRKAKFLFPHHGKLFEHLIELKKCYRQWYEFVPESQCRESARSEFDFSQIRLFFIVPRSEFPSLVSWRV